MAPFDPVLSSLIDVLTERIEETNDTRLRHALALIEEVAMDEQSVVAYVKHLDRLYLSALDEHDRLLDDPSAVNCRRADFTHRRYMTALVELRKRLGIAGDTEETR
jgi:hypothetical protein